MAKATCLRCLKQMPGTPVYMEGIRVVGECCRETASSDSLAARLSARIDRALAQVRSMKVAAPARPARAPSISKPSTTPEADRAAEALRYW